MKPANYILVNVSKFRSNSPRPRCLINSSPSFSRNIQKFLCTVSAIFFKLKNRIFNLTKQLSSADTIYDTYFLHCNRVSWQIQRIYRTRNLYIHSGKTVPFIEILVENLHAYLDRILDLMMENLNNTRSNTSIEQICLKQRLKHEAHLNLLKKNKNNICTKDTYKLMLFGEEFYDV